MGVEQGQIGKTEEMADLNKNQDPGVDSLSAARPYRPLSLRARLILLLFVIAIPLTGMALGFQKMIASYSASYDAILANLKTANEYNIKFKSDMEYSMYRVMIGLIDAEQFENGDIVEGETKYATVVKNPHSLIASARQAFGTTIEREPGSDCDIKIRGILSCLDSLERAVDKMIENAAAGGYYDENVNIWENDIQGLCSMIQDYITQYTYYEMINMEQLQKELKVQMADQMQSYLALLLVVLVIGMFLAVTITKSITEPLQQLQRTAEQLGRGNLNARARTGGLEEINVLARAFNQMSDRIRRLLDKTRQEQKNLRELELRLHQEQISPHFLYNTLDTMSGIANAQNCPMVSGMCHSLSAIFRYSLNMTDELSTVQNEMAHVRNYLYVMDVRNGSTIAYDYQIDSDTLADQMPRICIQPVVENALTHGLRNVRRKDKKLLIRSEHVNENLVITVQDNGAGMDAESMNRLLDQNDMKRVESGISIGILNVNARLKRLFGEKYGLHIESTAGEGTTVTITVPAVSTENSGDMENV